VLAFDDDPSERARLLRLLAAEFLDDYRRGDAIFG